jgi:hypothetical protein
MGDSEATFLEVLDLRAAEIDALEDPCWASTENSTWMSFCTTFSGNCRVRAAGLKSSRSCT